MGETSNYLTYTYNTKMVWDYETCLTNVVGVLGINDKEESLLECIVIESIGTE